MREPLPGGIVERLTAINGGVMVDERKYQIGVGTLVLEGIFQDPLDVALRVSWFAGATSTRYRRIWALSRMHINENEVIVGRIGFQSENEISSVIFDYDIADFRTEPLYPGTLVPFAVRLSDGRTVYQRHPGVVTDESFAGALAALLNVSPSPYAWRFDVDLQHQSWEQWRSDMSYVSGFDFRLERPNPHYADRDRVKEIIEAVNLEYARLTGRAREDGGVNTNDDLFRQSLDHILNDYGRGTVDGVTGDGDESRWIKSKGQAASVVTRLTVSVPDEGDEISDPTLIEVLRAQPTSQQVKGSDQGKSL